MSTDSAVAIVWDVLKCLVAPIKRGFGYVMYSESYANNLGKEVGNLESEVRRVRNAAEVARNNLQEIDNWVPEFLESAEEALMKAGDLLGEFEKASKTCCHGTLPDPNCRYQFCRKAKHETDHIKNLIGGNNGKEISFSGPPPGNVTALIPAGSEGKDVVQLTTTAASASSSVFESRALMIRNIMDALVDNRCSVVGVHGMGGLGKSTLLVDAEKKIREKKLFDWVAKADVSQIPDIKRIQGEIADALGLSDIKNKESVSGRAELLHRRLEEEERNKKKVLIILDNLWERLDLKSVGIPCGHDNKVVGCKLLLTSRDQNVLQRKMGCDEEFLLYRLKENEARTLFERIVGDKVHDEEFRPWVDETLRKCAGLPLLIVTVAKIFKYADLSEWRDALNQIERCSNEGISAVINEMLQLSYDHLESEEAKSLLQLCVACAASNPSLENLVRYGYGFGIFQKDSSMKEARDRLSTLIRTLQASSLLLDNGGADGFKIHDLVHDFVAQLVLRDHPLLVLKDEDMLATQLQNERLKSCSAICFPFINLKELPEKLDCPELHFFLLFNRNQSLEIPESFFNSMKKLAVLDLFNVCITRSLTSFQFLENLHTLSLQYCFLEDVAILSKLKGLQVLSFVNSNIQRLPKEIGQLIELRLLDLNNCSHLQIIEPGVLERLIKLEELYMEDSFDQWNATEQTQPTSASLIELNHMKNLCTLHVSIPDPSMLPEDLDVEKLTKYKIQIGNARRWSKQKGSRVLDLKLDLISDVLQKGCIQSVLSKTDDLFLDKLNGSKQSICALSQEGFPKLKHLLVQNSPSIHYILQWRTFGAFEMLESLFLEKLINLKKICYSHISSKSFCTLKVIQVESCDKMEVLFPLSLLRELPQLEEIKVVSCKLIRSIVEVDDHGKVELCNFHVLELRDLPNIKNFFTVRTTPSSSTLNERVGTQIAFFNGQQVAFNRLEKLKITGFDNLKFLFSPSMVKSFTQLKKLTISSCEKMKAIIMEEEWLGMETSEILAFPMLIKLRLQRLKSLTCFSHGKCAQESQSQNRGGSRAITLFNQEVAFPSLENLYMEGMDNIEMIWDDQIIADSFSKLKLLSVNECKKLVNVDPSFILGWLKSLETLTIEACESLEVVFKLQALNPLDGHHVAHSPLKKLELYDLPKLNRVWDRELHRQVKFQCLRWVSLRGCVRLTSLFSTSIARDLIQLEELEINKCGIVQLIGREGPNEPSIDVEAIEGPSQVESSFPSYFQHMKTIDVSHCHGLSNMFTPTIAKNLVEITKLRISKCDILTEVISDEGGNEGHVVAFNQLKHLELDGLTQMRCFSSGGYTLILPLLEDIIANRCPKMKFFFKGPMEAPKLKRVRVGLKRGYEATEYPYFWKGNVNMTIQNMFEEMATFAGTKFMRLSEFSELIGKWHSELNPITSSWQLESLVVGKCPSFINAIPSNLMLVLEKLTMLQVRDCELLEEIFDLKGLEAVDCTQALPQLQDLCLVNLPKLRQLWNRDLQGMMCFNSLQHLGLYKCSNLRHAFVSSMARCLPNLWKMEIKECNQMEGVIANEEGQGSSMGEITFPNLRRINLECLPNLTSFLSWKNHMLECPVLSMLSIAHCPKMISLTGQSLMEIDNGAPSLFTPQVSLSNKCIFGISFEHIRLRIIGQCFVV
ncbi:hypothetical protein BT93_H2712 [Corymbia citriodora subsp. variegata]|nr:hypothetical protein BT93_H2712 [Corymbia citriodora subsp. variegata]